MTFNSTTFALFLLIVGGAYYVLQFGTRRLWPQNLLLVIASLIFYGAWDHRFLFLVLISASIDYVAGLAMGGQRPTRRTSAAITLILLTSSVLLCAPLDWPALQSSLLPAAAYSGGFAEPVPLHGWFEREPNWLPLIGAFAATMLWATAALLGFRLPSTWQRRYFLVMSLTSNLTLLGFFKYYDFFVDSASRLMGTIGLGAHDWRLGIIVPVGISFYTFQTMSYTIDVYRGELKPTRSLLGFLAFVTFFPQLVAGPIEPAHALLPQMERRRTLDWNQIQCGVFLMGWGLFKKIFIADNLARTVSGVYDAHGSTSFTGPAVMLATYASAIQIYCDFSGYTDIARGVARLLGVELLVNFHNPYASTNPREFWRRWHISLSTWLRDYLYIPLGGSRGTAFMVYRNLMITMVLGGLWHGARANFIWWGAYQGLLLCVHRAIEPRVLAIAPRGAIGKKLYHVFCWIVFFHLTCYGWLLFRASSNAQIATLTIDLFKGWSVLAPYVGTVARLSWFIWPLLLVEISQVRSGNLLQPLTWRPPLRLAFYVTIFYLTVVYGAIDAVPFIYFQF